MDGWVGEWMDIHIHVHTHFTLMHTHIYTPIPVVDCRSQSYPWSDTSSHYDSTSTRQERAPQECNRH